MSETQDKPMRNGAPRWMKILLVASLGLNLLVLGAGLGAALHGGDKWRGGPGGPASPGAFTRALSEEDRAVLKRRMIREFRGQSDGRRAFREEISGIATALRAEIYDAEDVTARMARVREMFDGRLGSAQALLIGYWGEMSPEARAAYADRLEQEMKRRKR